MGEKHIPTVRVLRSPLYNPKMFTAEDVNFGARVIVELTGLFGMGKPIFFGEATSDQPVEAPYQVITIDKPTPMWYTEGEHGDKVVHGHLVEEVLVTPTEAEAS